jgi:hypothetical protein
MDALRRNPSKPVTVFRHGGFRSSELFDGPARELCSPVAKKKIQVIGTKNSNL